MYLGAKTRMVRERLGLSLIKMTREPRARLSYARLERISGTSNKARHQAQHAEQNITIDH